MSRAEHGLFFCTNVPTPTTAAAEPEPGPAGAPVPFLPPMPGGLPKTGAALGSMALIALLGVLGLFGFARRKKDEDEEE